MSVMFDLGQVVATPGALAAFELCGESPADYLRRHQAGDWGEVCEEDRQENELSILHGLRLISAYKLQNGVRIWIITEADRSSTCLLLPEEY